MAFTGVRKSGGNPNFLRGLDALRKKEVYVGIPDATTGRGGEISNAALMFIHSRGSPKHNIPARPVIEPALAQPEAQQRIGIHLQAAAKHALNGDVGGAMAEMEDAGMVGESVARDYFLSGNLAPNKPETVRRKGSDTPLIDTGILRGAITHVVRDK